MFMTGIPDLRDQLGNQPAMINRLWLQPLFLAAFDLFQIRFIQRHLVPHDGLLLAPCIYPAVTGWLL